MSQKIQVENNLAFECCAQMVWWCLGAFQGCPTSFCGASKSVWRCLAVFVGISGVRCCFGGDWRGLLVYLGGNEIRSELLGGFGGFFWQLSPCDIIQARANPPFWPNSERQDFFTWIFLDIKISKPPYVSLPKIIGFCHFSWFLGLSERNYKSQSLWITL